MNARNQRLVEASKEAMKHSYAPYSKFHVGAALIDKNGTIWTGCNVENCSYGGAICAERTAYVKAVSEGVREFEAIAISAYSSSQMASDDWIYPCGICRQFMVEFGNVEVILTRISSTLTTGRNEETKITTLTELLPEAFTPKSLIASLGKSNQ
eukprot:Partr_v1_DN22686_c0_g1_i1_m5230 putative cytidine deaminase